MAILPAMEQVKQKWGFYLPIVIVRIKYVTCKSHTDKTAMEKYLSERPNTILKQSKYSHDRTKKYEYQCCTCGCGFRLQIVVKMVNGNAFETREIPVPDNHDPLSAVVNWHHRMDKEVSQMIVELLEQNQFSKNFGPSRSCLSYEDVT